MIIGNMANVILDPVMILLLGWNVAGAAIATVIGNILSAVFYVSHLLSKNHSYRFDYRITKPETKLRVPYLPLVSRHH